MDPVSTFFLIASFTAGTATTARPRWEAPKIEAKSPHTPLVLRMPVPTSILVAPTAAKPQPFATLKDRLLVELQSFVPGHPKGDPGIVSNEDDIRTASDFIKILPGGIPLPTLMRNDDGHIGMYWDNDDAYIDINIDHGSTLSLFSRIRSTGEETFIPSIPLASTTPDWAFENLAALVHKHAVAA